ncbi:MAG: hypothetical protein WBD99_11175 [Thermodesulfobacteriota bacterium]
MIPHFLKSIKISKPDNKKQIVLNPELEISLSLIESGCITASVNDETLFIFKHSQDVIESLRGIEKITFELESLKRPEFPTIVMLFCLEGNHNHYQFEYSFAIGSEQDMELLKKLLEQDHFCIYFFDTKIRYSKMVSLNNNDAEYIKSIIIEATG